MPTKRIAPLRPSRLDVERKFSKAFKDSGPLVVAEWDLAKVEADLAKVEGDLAKPDLAKADLAKAERAKAHLKKRRSSCKKRTDHFCKLITPAAKQAAIDNHRKINAKCLEYFRQHGAPKNTRHFIQWLEDERVLTRNLRKGRSSTFTEKAVREVLFKNFGIRGEPGRKPTRPTS